MAGVAKPRVWLPAKPTSISVTDSKGNPPPDLQSSWDDQSKTEWLGFGNSPEGIKAELKW